MNIVLSTTGGPDAAEHLEITFEEDLDRPQQAIVYITWDSPSG